MGLSVVCVLNLVFIPKNCQYIFPSYTHIYCHLSVELRQSLGDIRRHRRPCCHHGYGVIYDVAMETAPSCGGVRFGDILEIWGRAHLGVTEQSQWTG